MEVVRWLSFSDGPPGRRVRGFLPGYIDRRFAFRRPAISFGRTGGTITIHAKEMTIPFHALDFDYGGQEVYVFYCLSEDRLIAGARPRIRDHWDNRMVGLESVILGERNLGQQSLEVVICGYSSPEEAEDALRRQMEDLIRT